MADPLIGMTFAFEAPAPAQDQAPRGGLGSQVLPVAELDEDFDGSPEDGSQYLALNPYETIDAEVEQDPTAVPSTRPSQAWREVFVRNFEAARKRMLAAPTHSLLPVNSATIPLPRDEGAWRVFVNGKRTKVKPPPVAKTVVVPVSAVGGTNGAGDVVQEARHAVEMSELEAAKAAVLASLDLDAHEPAEATLMPPPSPPVAAPPTPAPQIPEYERLPQLPSPALIVAIPPTSLIHVLSHFNEWFNERIDAYDEALNFVPSTIFAPPSMRRKGVPSAKAVPAPAASKKPPPKPPLPSAHEVQWILSLLTRLERLLDGEDLGSLRQLAKTLIQLAEESAAKQPSTIGRSIQQRTQDEEDAEGRARCWMVVAAIAHVWAQGDLWDSSL
ncbi:hypothetical protein JCM10213v2_004468 [Rhodosporidiobolus nylandii]